LNFICSIWTAWHLTIPTLNTLSVVKVLVHPAH